MIAKENPDRKKKIYKIIERVLVSVPKASTIIIKLKVH